MVNVAILDDYANAARALADWTPVARQAQIQVFTQHLSDREMIAALQPFEIVCTLRERSRFSGETLAQLPNLKVIIVTDGHVSTVDNEAATARGILVCEGRAPDDMPAAPNSTAEFAWALMLAIMRHIPEESQRLRGGEWQHSLGDALAGRTLGIVVWARSASAWPTTRTRSTCRFSPGVKICPMRPPGRLAPDASRSGPCSRTAILSVSIMC